MENLGNQVHIEPSYESQLTMEINTLWGEHVRVARAKKITTVELRYLRATLAEKLFTMKRVLSRPGRLGQWRSWLEEVTIPRSTADRLVERHAEISGEATGNVPSEAFTPEQRVEALVKATLPRLRKVLTSPKMVYQFVCAVVAEFGLDSKASDGGILLMQPTCEQEPTSEDEPCLDNDAAAENVDEVPIESGFDDSPVALGGETASL
jgi:hypothetical protein